MPHRVDQVVRDVDATHGRIETLTIEQICFHHLGGRRDFRAKAFSLPRQTA